MNEPQPSLIPPPTLDLFQQMVFLTENMNTLKKHVNTEKCSRHENLAHLDPVSSDKEELPVPIISVPVVLLIDAPLTSDTVMGLSSDPSFPNHPPIFWAD